MVTEFPSIVATDGIASWVCQSPVVAGCFSSCQKVKIAIVIIKVSNILNFLDFGKFIV